MQIILRLSCLILGVTLLLAGCAAQGPGSAGEPLSSNSRRLMMEGLTADQVVQKWGTPQVVLRNNYIILTYGQPAILPPFDEQWSYPTDKGHRLIYWSAGKVVLAVEEWTDS